MVTEDTDGLIYSSLKSFNMWKLATLEGWCPLNSWTVESCPVEVVLLCGVALRCRGPSTPRCTAQLTVLLTLFWGVLSTWFALTNLKKSRCLFFSNSQDYSDLDVSFWVILNKDLVHFVNPGHIVVQKEALYKVLRLFFITNHRDGHDKNINAEVL